MREHIRYNKNRREFLTNCFCGFGSLAFASMTAQEQARLVSLGNKNGRISVTQ